MRTGREDRCRASYLIGAPSLAGLARGPPPPLSKSSLLLFCTWHTPLYICKFRTTLFEFAGKSFKPDLNALTRERNGMCVAAPFRQGAILLSSSVSSDGRGSYQDGKHAAYKMLLVQQRT